MRILFCGDVVGRAGRRVLVDKLPRLRADLRLDIVIVNGENAAGGFGITPEICRDFYAAGADLITTGNHVFDQRELIGHLEQDPRMLRPLTGNASWASSRVRPSMSSSRRSSTRIPNCAHRSMPWRRGSAPSWWSRAPTTG